ncbi:hypothetical protein ACHWQZ_G008710 [Mnemiopsis leidyi]
MSSTVVLLSLPLFVASKIGDFCDRNTSCRSVFETCAESLHVDKYGEKFGFCQEVNFFDQWWLLLISCIRKFSFVPLQVNISLK